MRTFYSILILSFALLSCEDRRTLEFDDFEKEVVLNAIISTDSAWRLNLTYTQPSVDLNTHDAISNASVYVVNKTNGQSFFLDEKKEGSYCRELRPAEGHEYELSIEIEDHPLIKASTYLPSVLNVDVVSQAVLDSEGLSSIEIDIEIEDNPDEENFYVWELKPYVKDTEELPIVDPELEIPGVYTLGPDLGNPGSGKDIPSRGEVSNDFIFSVVSKEDIPEIEDSKTKSFNSPSFISDKGSKEGKIVNRLVLDNDVLSDLSGSSSIDIDPNPDTSSDREPIFQLSVKAVSGELFQYLQTYEAYKSEKINTSIVAPTTIYSNIENGLGIFGGYSLKTFNIY